MADGRLHSAVRRETSFSAHCHCRSSAYVCVCVSNDPLRWLKCLFGIESQESTYILECIYHSILLFPGQRLLHY